jgi:hypothetical protein
MDWVPPEAIQQLAVDSSMPKPFVDPPQSGNWANRWAAHLLAILKWSTDADNVAKLKAAPDMFCRSASTVNNHSWFRH